jgi:hypothetical protein
MPEGCRLSGVEIVCACGLPAWQALGMWPGRARLQACAGLRGTAQWSRYLACLWIPGLLGLRGLGLAEIVNSCGCGFGRPWGNSPVEQRSCRPVQAWGHSPVDIVHACGSLPWQALRAQSGGDHAGLRGGSLGECGPGRAEEWAQGSEIQWPAEQWLCRPMGLFF